MEDKCTLDSPDMKDLCPRGLSQLNVMELEEMIRRAMLELDKRKAVISQEALGRMLLDMIKLRGDDRWKFADHFKEFSQIDLGR